MPNHTAQGRKIGIAPQLPELTLPELCENLDFSLEDDISGIHWPIFL